MNEKMAMDERAAAAEIDAIFKEKSALDARLSAAQKALSESNARIAQARATDAARGALECAGCRPERLGLVLRAISGDLRTGDDGVVRGTGRLDGAAVELDLDQYVAKIVAKDFSEMFGAARSSVTPGSGGSGDYDFTEEQVADSEFYAAHRDAIIKAFESNRVRPRQRQRA